MLSLPVPNNAHAVLAFRKDMKYMYHKFASACLAINMIIGYHYQHNNGLPIKAVLNSWAYTN